MKLLNTFALLTWLSAPRVMSQVQLLNFTTAATNLSSTCVAVLNQAVTCNTSLTWAGQGRFESSDTLTGLCTSTCASSLSTWLRRAAGACTSRYVDANGNAVLPALWVESVVENYNLLCLQNGAQFCNLVVGAEAGINPNDQSQTSSAVPSITCDDCFLKQIQTRLEMPLQSNSALASTFSSLTSQCGKTGFSVTPIATTTTYIIPGSTTVSSGGSTQTPGACSGTVYTIQSGDTCNSVASAQGINTVDLLAVNNIASCSTFPTSGSLCIPALSKCKTYTVQSGDTCASVADANGLTWTQVVTWNPEVGTQCTFMSTYVGYQICISTPGGAWVNPSPVTTTSSTTTTPAFVGTAISLLPSPTWPGSMNGSDDWAYNFASGTRLDCLLYANGTQFGANASCSEVANGYGVDQADLVAWNPSLNTTCTLNGDLTYCVRFVGHNATNFTQYCVLDDAPGFNTTCAEFLAVWGVGLDDFAQWNPGVGSNCENWDNGADYCVMVEHFRQPGYVSTCNLFAMANDTNYRNDPCGDIETQYGISHARFVAWNPAVYNNCTGLKYHYDYCVSIPNYKPTYTSRVISTPSVIPGATATTTYLGGDSAPLAITGTTTAASLVGTSGPTSKASITGTASASK